MFDCLSMSVRAEVALRSVPRLGLACVLLALSATAPVQAQNRGSQADQEACTPDVFRLCSDYIPDEPAILVCLQGKQAELSPACGKVIGPPPGTRTRRHRA